MQADPVCGQRVRERGNQQRAEYAGQRYFFCSSECLQRFDAQPDLFTAGPAEGRIAQRDRGLLPGKGARIPPPSPAAKIEQATVDAGPG